MRPPSISLLYYCRKLPHVLNCESYQINVCPHLRAAVADRRPTTKTLSTGGKVAPVG